MKGPGKERKNKGKKRIKRIKSETENFNNLNATSENPMYLSLLIQLVLLSPFACFLLSSFALVSLLCRFMSKSFAGTDPRVQFQRLLPSAQ